MNDSVLVEALRARDPGALAALYDSYAESIYRYARAVLESPDSAQVALRDTLIAAEAHVHALADPERLRVWLYALARGECLRRRSVVLPADGEETVEGGPIVPDAPDGDLRLVAVNAVGALSDDEREILDLLTRHAIPDEEFATVLGITAAEADQLRRHACERLQDLVTTEILARDAAHDCAGRTSILADFSCTLDEETREQLLQHIEHCTACSPHLERQISASKVFNLLPQPVLPETLRVRVMSCFIDPELVPYRQYVARRTGLLDADGFPVRDTKGVRRRPQALAGAVAAFAIITAAVVLVSALSGAQDPLSRSAYGAFPPAQAPSTGVTPSAPDPTGPPSTPTPIADGTPTLPVASPGSKVPVAVVRPGSGVPVLPMLMPTPSPSTSSHAPTSRPSSSSPSSSPSPSAEPTDVVPPVTTPPVTPPQPPRGQPSGEPTPTVSHQDDPAPTPCPSRTRLAAPAAPSPPKGSAASQAPSSVRSHARHAVSAGYRRGPRREGAPRPRTPGRREERDPAPAWPLQAVEETPIEAPTATPTPPATP